MRRYINFRDDEWMERTDSRMQAARWAACVNAIDDQPPSAGVIDSYPQDLLESLLEEGWVSYPESLQAQSLRDAAQEAVLFTLSDDVDCLSMDEHTLVERMLIGDGSAQMETVAEMEAGYTLRMRLWCDLGFEDGAPAVRMDSALREALPPLLMRREHQERRARIFIYDGMINGMLYVAGFLDDHMPRVRFVEEVLQAEQTPASMRLARNYLEASYDTCPVAGHNLLVHEALADPEALEALLQSQDPLLFPEISPGDLAGSMNGLLPQEAIPDEKLQRALHGALRPEYETYEATSDLRFLAKQDAPLDTLEEIMASMLFVLPTQHMNGALREMRHSTPRWIRRHGLMPPPAGVDGPMGLLH